MTLIEKNLSALCGSGQPLSCLAVSYGTAAWQEHAQCGLAQETDASLCPAPLPLGEDALFDLASLTKFFTALMMMWLMEHRRLRPEETVGQVDARFTQLQSVPVGDLVCYLAHLETPGRLDEGCGRQEALRRLFAARRTPTPPVRIYSDINAMVCKYLVEERTGMAFYEALAHYLLTPLGMTDTVSHVPGTLRPRCVSTNCEHQLLHGQYLVRTDVLPGSVNDPKARVLSPDGRDLCGHAGLFSTLRDMTRLLTSLLQGAFLSPDALRRMGADRTGRKNADGTYRQPMGCLCFTNHPVQYYSELPRWMHAGSLGLSGFTGNHLCLDPWEGTFLVYLGSRCHNRVSRLALRPGETPRALGLGEDYSGRIAWPDGRKVACSAEWVHRKDALLHDPIRQRMLDFAPALL